MKPMTKADLINEYAEFNDMDLLTLGAQFEDAIMGLAEHWTREGTRAEHICYSKQGIIEALMKDGLNESAAWEYAEFNIFCAYYGPGTPVYVDELADVKSHGGFDDLFGDGSVYVNVDGAE
jgi:hypothetical protein